MPGIPKLSLVEGSFEELASELATYLDTLKGADSNVLSEVTPLLADAESEASAPSTTNKDDVLKKLVGASSVLNNAPERELQAAYNLLIHLISQAEDPDMFISRICQYLTQPITASPHNGAGLALGILGTLFNTVEPDDETRYFVLLAIVDVIKGSRNFETLQPQLKGLEDWISEWECDPAQARKLYLAISDAAAAATEPAQSYIYLLKTLRTLQNEASSAEARTLSQRALKAALQDPTHFDFQDLTALDSIQALRKSDETLFELLELFSSENYEELQEFKETNDDFLSSATLDEDILDRKMRLLTLASLASHAADSRTLPYAQIARALSIPSADVEMWVIDCIRSGLVEGKLSQSGQVFLVHRCSYRNFGEKQWREVETWKGSLNNVLAVIRAQRDELAREQQQQSQQSEQGRGGYRPRMGQQRNMLDEQIV